MLYLKIVMESGILEVTENLPLTREVAKSLILTEGEKMKEYNKSNIPLAKTLRKNITPWERKLWYDF